ncbi:MAG: MBL fold metallo-hydrolase [Lachnospiraceae bacterium]|nr:MBL fold metallo-hydrolase [Lachnospiraceae bacterium]
MKITALVENTTKRDCPTEHGLSLYIETARHNILFDTGQTTLFADNAERFGVDLSSVDLCMLSHGHYDHGGGLKKFTEVNDHAKIYMNKHAFGWHYHGEERYIGLNRDWIDDEAMQERIVYVDGDLTIDEELSIYGPRPHKKIDMGAAGLTMKVGGKFLPEDFRHEHYLLIWEGDKTVLISGCSHQGILNIMEWFHPDVCIGGFHFMKEEPGERLRSYGKVLAGYQTTYYTCHCTGVEQFAFLQPIIPQMHYLAEGDVIEV